MVSQRLIDFIKNHVKQGYSIASIKKHLLNYGYNINDIENAVGVLYKTKETGISKNVIIISIVVLVLIIGGIGAYFLMSGDGDEIPDFEEPEHNVVLELSGLVTSVEPGQSISFLVDLEEMQGKTGVVVDLKYELISTDTGSVLSSKEEKKNLGDHEISIDVPSDAELGNYIINAEARYDGETVKDTLAVSVYKKTAEATCFDNEQNQNEEGVDCGGPCDACKRCPSSCDDNDECTKDECGFLTDHECRHERIAGCAAEPVSGDKIVDDPELFKDMSMWEILDKIKEISEDDLERAGRLCEGIYQQIYKDRCFSSLAQTTSNFKNCERIQDERTKDNCFFETSKIAGESLNCDKIVKETRRNNCYMHFVMQEDYSVCDKLTDEYLQRSCESLKRLSEIQTE